MPTWAERIATPGFTLSNSSPTILMTGGSFGSMDLLVGEPDRDRIGVEEIVGVGAETFLQLLVDAVARAMADEGAELQPLLARLPEQQRDVRIVAGVEDHVGPRALQLGDQRGEIGRGGGIAFLQHDVEAGLLGAGLVALGDVDAIGAVLVDDGDAQILRLLAELLLGVLRDEIHRHHAELVAGRLRTEHVFVVLVRRTRRRKCRW